MFPQAKLKGFRQPRRVGAVERLREVYSREVEKARGGASAGASNGEFSPVLAGSPAFLNRLV